jgi:hypothetical protein
MSTFCMYCGGAAERRHHGTGRDDRERYFHPGLVFDACHNDHMLVHDDWRSAGIERPGQRLTFVERVELFLRRLAATLCRMDAGLGTGFWQMLAAVLQEWADELRRFIDHLSERDPDWRQDSGFYPA